MFRPGFVLSALIGDRAFDANGLLGECVAQVGSRLAGNHSNPVCIVGSPRRQAVG